MSKHQLIWSTKAVVTKVCIFLNFAEIRYHVHGSKLIKVNVYFRLLLQTECLLWHSKGIATGTAENSLGSQVEGRERVTGNGLGFEPASTASGSHLFPRPHYVILPKQLYHEGNILKNMSLWGPTSFKPLHRSLESKLRKKCPKHKSLGCHCVDLVRGTLSTSCSNGAFVREL